MRSGATTAPLLPQLVTSLGITQCYLPPGRGDIPSHSWDRERLELDKTDFNVRRRWSVFYKPVASRFRARTAQRWRRTGEADEMRAGRNCKKIAIPRFEHLKLCMFMGVNHGDGETRLPWIGVGDTSANCPPEILSCFKIWSSRLRALITVQKNVL